MLPKKGWIDLKRGMSKKCHEHFCRSAENQFLDSMMKFFDDEFLDDEFLDDHFLMKFSLDNTGTE